MQSPRYYFEKSLFGYFCKRIAEKWGHPPKFPDAINYYGVMLQLDCLPRDMQSVIMAGNYELSEIMIAPDFIEAGDSVLEIGSAIGFIGLYCRKILKCETCVGVEPNPTTISYLQKNYNLNGIDPCIIPVALAERDGPTQFYVSEMFWCDSLERRTDVDDGKGINIEGLTFESIIKRAGVDFNTLIIDIEGGEKYLPVNGIPKQVQKILIEIHPEVIGIRDAYSLIEQLIVNGFQVRNRVHNTWALQRD